MVSVIFLDFVNIQLYSGNSMNSENAKQIEELFQEFANTENVADRNRIVSKCSNVSGNNPQNW